MLRRGGALAAVLSILAVTFAFYARTLDDYWIKDDLLIGNLTDGAELDWGRLTHYAWPSAMRSDQFWRPIPMLLGFVDYEIWGPEPFGFHLTNTLLHGVVAVLLFFTVNALLSGRSRAPGLLAALLLVTCPSTPEAVVWTLQRMVLTCAAFSLLGVLAWLRAAREGGRIARVLGLAALVAAILSKEIAVVLPGCWFVIDLLHGREPSLAGRAVRAFRNALPPAAILAVYFAMRWVLWGRFDLAYAGLSPSDYAAANDVFGRMGASLANVLLPVNAAIFPEPWRGVLRGTMAAGLLLALLRGAVLLARDVAFRRAAAVWAAMGLLFFLPATWIFWVTPDLFNGRLFYQSALAIAALAGSALVHRTGDRVVGARGIAVAGRLGAVLLIGAQAIALGGGLVAFEDASAQVRGIQTAIEEVADRHEAASGSRPVVVALNVPSMVAGVPTLETSLVRALSPPLSHPGVEVVPLMLTTRHMGRAWWEQLRAHVEARELPWSDLRYVWCEYEPPGVRPVFPTPSQPHGRAAELVAPPDGLALPNDAAAPVLTFRPAEGTTSVVVIELERGPEFRFTLHAGLNADRAADGTLRFDVDRGDPELPETVGAWSAQIRRPLPFPYALTWHVASFDEAGALVGRSATRRLLVVDVLGAP